VAGAMESLNLDRFGRQKVFEQVCLGVVAVLVDPDRVEHSDHPNDVTLVSWEDEFRMIADRHDVSMSDLSTIKELVREELSGRSFGQRSLARRDVNLPKLSPSKYPDEYWETYGPESRVIIAKHVDLRDEEFKVVILDEK
jgi:hypothetical protein